MKEQTEVQQPQPPTDQDLRAELARRDQAIVDQALQSIVSLAQQLGVEIVAWSVVTADGRLAAQWGVKRLQR